MNHFIGDTEIDGKKAEKDLVSLRKTFQPWINRAVQTWHPLAFPQRPDATDHPMIARRPNTRVSKTKRARAKGSFYKDNFIPTANRNIHGRLSRAKVRVDIAMAGDDPVELVKAGMAEQFCLGIANMLDGQFTRAGLTTNFLHYIAGYETWPGKIIARTTVETAPGTTNEAKIDVQIWDPLTCFHDFDKWPRRFIHEELLSGDEVAELLETQGIPIPDDLNDAIKGDDALLFADYYLEEPVNDVIDEEGNTVSTRHQVWNAYMVEGKTVKAPFIREKWDHLPITAISLHAVPNERHDSSGTGAGSAEYTAAISSRSQLGKKQPRTNPDFLLRHAMPWYEDLVHTIPQFEGAKSLEYDAMFEAVHPPRITKNKDGTFTVKDEEWGPGVELRLKQDEFLSYLEKRAPNLDQFTVVASLEQDKENAFPRFLRGSSPGIQISGYALNQEIDLAELAIAEEAIGASRLLEGIFQEAIDGVFRQDLKVRMSFRNNKGEQMGKFAVSDFSKLDLPEHYAMMVRVAPQLPRDLAAQIQMFIQVTGARGASRLRGMADYIGTQDPWEEMLQMEREMVRDAGVNREQRVLDALQEEAEVIRQELNGATGADRNDAFLRLRVKESQIQAQWSVLQAGIPPPLGPQPGGFSSSTLPAEATGESPDVQAANEGRVSSATGGRPPGTRPLLPGGR